METKESLPAEEVIAQYFNSKSGIVTPSGELIVPGETTDSEPSTSTNKPASATKKNPSNPQTDTSGTGKDKP